MISHEVETIGQHQSAVTFTSRKELPGVTGNKLGGTENQLGAMKQRKILLLLLGIGP